MSDVTPGQAAYEARQAAKARRMGAPDSEPDSALVAIIGLRWEELPAGMRADEEAGAQAAIAARQPQPAPGCPDPAQHRDVYGRPLPDTMPQPVPGDASAIVDTAVKEWLDRRTATALATAPGIDDREQGKRQGIEQLRYGHLDDYWYVLTPAILAALGTEPQPVPGDTPEIRITDCSAHHDALHIQINTGHNWLCAVALSAILAEYEPQPADDVKPAPEPAMRPGEALTAARPASRNRRRAREARDATEGQDVSEPAAEPAIVHPAGTNWVLVKGYHDSGTIHGVYGPYTEAYVDWLLGGLLEFTSDNWTKIKLSSGPEEAT